MFQLHEVAPVRQPITHFPIAEQAQEAKPQFHREVLRSGKRAGQSFAIRLAYDDQDRTSASAIINRLYGRRGYGSDHQVSGRSECMTFTACCDDEMIGTLTLRVDSPTGLVADETFPRELAQLRAQPGANLCELTKFAFDPSPDSRPLLAKLFHVIFAFGTHHFACSDLVIEVNPRHVLFYECMLGFSRIGELGTNDVVHAPAQLMHLSVSRIGENISRYADAQASGARSLYPYFFGKAEEEELRQRIAAGGLERELPHYVLNADVLHRQRSIRHGQGVAQQKRAAA
jgi:hypothetical protein